MNGTASLINGDFGRNAPANGPKVVFSGAAPHANDRADAGYFADPRGESPDTKTGWRRGRDSNSQATFSLHLRSCRVTAAQQWRALSRVNPACYSVNLSKYINETLDLSPGNLARFPEASIAAGEFVQASGRWETQREHGLQFRANFLRVTAPISAEGMEKYLGSGLIKGIGPVFAQRLVSTFNEMVFEVIEQTPDHGYERQSLRYHLLRRGLRLGDVVAFPPFRTQTNGLFDDGPL